VQRGGGAGGTDRVTFAWRDGQIRNAWLRVRALPGGRAAGAAGDVFIFGSLAGETGDGAGWTTVSAADVLRVRAAVSAAPVRPGNAFDFNRDGQVNARDVAIARANVGQGLATPILPAAAAAPPRRSPTSRRTAEYLLEG
jgi:hypothetical protein